jgi:ribonuclease HII
MPTPLACPAYEAELARGRPVVGVDEVGRGPLAGPVVSAAVFFPEAPVEGLKDSKALTEKRRDALYAELVVRARFGIGAVSSKGIDRLGIEQATKLAMCRAVTALGASAGALVIVDGNRAPDFGREAIAEVRADASCPSVSAAAIIAKVIRDRAMARLAVRYQDYGWHTNKGYGSRSHCDAILSAGPTPHHRRSFLVKLLGRAA